MKQYVGTEISGAHFNKVYDGLSFVKLTNEYERHNGFLFFDGLNIDTKRFYPNGECQAGGIYFIEKNEAHKWIYYGYESMKYIREVTVPNDARVYVEDDKFKADKLILGSRILIDKEIYLNAMRY